MRIHRSNPWPALADLFAALLITSFGALVAIGAAGAKKGDAVADGMRRNASLTAQVKNLSEAIKKGNDDRIMLARQLEWFRGQYAALAGRNGLDLPPCLIRENHPLPLIEIAVVEDGMQVKMVAQPEYGHLLSSITGLESLVAAGTVSDDDFRTLATPISAWGRDSRNALGIRCSFYAILKPSSGVGKSRLATARAYAEEAFYLFNAGQISQFMKADED